MLAEWPWRNDHGSWYVVSIQKGNALRSTNGSIAPRFEYYESHFKRRDCASSKQP